MRIVGGRYKRLALVAPKGLATRPTTDRVRETLFNILSNRIDFDGLRVLDLFAGTGALGLESISRGANFALFVEKAPAAQAAIRSNVAALDVSDSANLLRRDATRLGDIAEVDPFDLVFADPPYGKGLGERAGASAVAGGWLKPSATFVLEEQSQSFPQSLKSFDLIDKRQFGETTIGVFQFNP